MDQQNVGIGIALLEAMWGDCTRLILERRIAVIEEKSEIVPAVPGRVIPDF
jgi:hypothetical protein